MMHHCGSDHATREELAAMPVPEPMGPRHVIRPFIDDVELVANGFAANGLKIKSEAFGVTKDAENIPTQFFGLFELDHEDAAEDFGLMVGLRGSYNQRLPRGLAVGSNVFVCDNLAFSGEIELHTKQTTFINDRLPQMINEACSRIPALATLQTRKFEGFRLQKIMRRVGDAMLVEMVRRGIMVPSQLGRALAEWDKPIHDEHAEDGFSLWRLHNAVTEAIKPANPERGAVPAIWDRTTKLTDFLDEVTGPNGFRVYAN
jgi:hypothetical protein